MLVLCFDTVLCAVLCHAMLLCAVRYLCCAGVFRAELCAVLYQCLAVFASSSLGCGEAPKASALLLQVGGMGHMGHGAYLYRGGDYVHGRRDRRNHSFYSDKASAFALFVDKPSLSSKPTHIPSCASPHACCRIACITYHTHPPYTRT